MAYNEAETSMFADVARTEFNVDGTGVTIGVLSDSVNQYTETIRAAPAWRNPTRPAISTPTIPSTCSRTARAAAPTKAARCWRTSTTSPPAPAWLSRRPMVATWHSPTISRPWPPRPRRISSIDDVGYPDEPMFQDGFISQAINTVVGERSDLFQRRRQRVQPGLSVHFRADHRDDHRDRLRHVHEFRSQRRRPTSSCPSRPMGPTIRFRFEYDQPFATQQPAGSTATVTSNVNIYVIDAATGAVVVGTASNSNNVATQEPLQIITIPAAGSYFVAIQVVSGANPGHVEFVNDNENVNLIVSQQFGSAGRNVLSQFVSDTRRAPTRSGSARLPGGRRRPTWGRIRSRTSHSARSARRFMFSIPTALPLTAGPTVIQNPTDHRPGRRQHFVLLAGPDHQYQQPSVPG